MELDSSGLYGQIFHYALIFAMMGMSLLFFIYVWKKGRLDMDESPKFEMMEDDNHES